MTQLSSGRPPGVRGRPQSDIYTVLLAVATGFVVVGTIYVAVQMGSAFGSLFPPAGG